MMLQMCLSCSDNFARTLDHYEKRHYHFLNFLKLLWVQQEFTFFYKVIIIFGSLQELGNVIYTQVVTSSNKVNTQFQHCRSFGQDKQHGPAYVFHYCSFTLLSIRPLLCTIYFHFPDEQGIKLRHLYSVYLFQKLIQTSLCEQTDSVSHIGF